MNISFRPIEKWPREMTSSRRRAPFKSGYSSTIALLLRELRMFGYANSCTVQSVVLQLAMQESDFKLDGMPRANAKASHPGVIVSFEANKSSYNRTNHKTEHRVTPYAFPCDSFTTWEQNLRAISLALEALRKVDRYGVTKHSEQYTGWRTLPPPQAESPAESPIGSAFRLSQLSGFDQSQIMTDSDYARRAYTAACMRWHPDRNNGIQKPEWHELQSVWERVKKHLSI